MRAHFSSDASPKTLGTLDLTLVKPLKNSFQPIMPNLTDSLKVEYNM